MDILLIIISILFFLLIILTLSRTTSKEHFEKVTIGYENIPFDRTYDIPFNKDLAFALCDNCCEKFVKQEWENLEKQHGWAPFGYWNGQWYQQKLELKYKPKYRLLCGCNIEY